MIRRVSSGDAEALAGLYDRYGRLAYGLALSVLGDGALAEEVTQEVFIRVWERAETYRPENGRVATWIASLARHRAIDVYRARRSRPEGNLVGFSVEDALDLPNDHNVESSVEKRAGRSRVRQALARLPAEQRQALAYAFFLGYSHGEIARALGQPLGTVKTRIRLAMRKLRDDLSGEMSPE